MDNRTCYCRNAECALYGRVAPLARLRFCEWHRAAVRFECQACSQRVSARAGTAYAGVRMDLRIYLRGVTALAEGLSIRGTGRLLGVDKDTVMHWLPGLGRHCQRVMSYFFRNLHLSECQLDELWTFIYKKEERLAPLEKLQAVYGDAWVWIAFSPVCKLVPAWVVGKRTLPHARRLVFRLKSAMDGHIPFFTSDELPHYADALLEVYGQWVQPARHGTRGRFPEPRRVPPPDLCYAVVVKEREKGRVVEVTTRIVYGTTQQVAAALQTSPVSRAINTYGVERNNLTIRQHSRRMGRKVNAFSKDPDYLEHQLTLAFAYYHFVIPHRGLRQRLPRALPTKGRTGSHKKWRPVTPAMAAGLTDHVWTIDELLSFRVPPKRLW
jgi:IS1 family transposase